MEVVVLNIPVGFRDSLSIRREDYEPIGEGPSPLVPVTRTWIATFILCLVLCLAGLVTFGLGYPIAGSAVLFMVPASCTVYWILDRSKCFGCLTRICSCSCCRAAEIDTPETYTSDDSWPSQPLLQPPASDDLVSGPPESGNLISEPPALEGPVSNPPALEDPVWKPPALEDWVSEPPALKDPVLESPALEDPVSEPPALKDPVSKPPALEDPVSEPPALEDPVSKPPGLEDPVSEPPALEDPVSEPRTEV